MTRARTPRPHEIDQARHDERLLRALREGGRDPAWRTRGACQDVDPETFFPAPSEPADNAMALCRTCPVLGACLAWALRAGDLHGVWGGTTARERRAMAVVWHNGQLDPLSPAAAPATRPPMPATPAPVPAARAPAALPELGAVMDRAELLRLVKAG
ncbi:MAG: WhiB family transcriptional regulator [Micromonosporaceae bacterium]|nr:WhiB family transcriptional regulator [Micromonosporaceae bacterium]